MHLNHRDFSTIQKDNSVLLKTNTYKQLHRVLPTLLSIARSCPLENRYPILKLLKELSKTFRLNEFQATFFTYMVRETKWNFKDPLISQNSQQVNGIFGNYNQQGEYKSIILYLVLVIFTLKKILNEHNHLFQEEAIQICPNFVNIFQRWCKKHSKLAKVFNPKMLNKIYHDINFKTTLKKPNFNILVDSILEISPPYNSSSNKNKKSQNEEKVHKQKISVSKDKQANKLTLSSDSISINKNEENDDAEINAIFSTERLHEMVEGVCLQNSMIEVSDFQAFGLKKLTNISYNIEHSLFGSSESGDHYFQAKNEDYFCYQLKLGQQEGQSQNAKIDGKVPDCSQNIVLSASRLNLTDQFLNWKVQGQEYNY